VGALVTLDLPDDSPVLALPWIVTFGPLDDNDDWEPVVCGPYERAHALSIAETVVADEELMAVVEPLQPHTSVEAIRGEIDRAKAFTDEEESGEYEMDAEESDHEHEGEDAEFAEFNEEDFEELEEVEPTPAPSPDEVRAGFARIAARLTTAGV
jgi:hypothetical protein